MKYIVVLWGLGSFCMNLSARAPLSSIEQVTQALQKSIKTHNRHAAHVAITLGADINAYDAITGYTPLIQAIISGDVMMVEALLIAGADGTLVDAKKKNVDYYVQLLAQEKKQQAHSIMRLLDEYK